MAPYGLKQHLESCCVKKDKSGYLHQVALLYLDASARGGEGEHCLATGNNTGIRGLLPSINEVVALDTVA